MHYLAEGPNNSFVMSGWLESGIYMDMIKTTNQCSGHKKVKFADGGEIVFNHTHDELRNLTIGTINQRLVG